MHDGRVRSNQRISRLFYVTRHQTMELSTFLIPPSEFPPFQMPPDVLALDRVTPLFLQAWIFFGESGTLCHGAEYWPSPPSQPRVQPASPMGP